MKFECSFCGNEITKDRTNIGVKLERQDFPKVFFDLCEKIARNKVYIAGDIFQDIFDSIQEAAYHMWKSGEKPWEIWTESPHFCTAFFKKCEYYELCEMDFHPAVLQNYQRSEWQPYMGHEKFKGKDIDD